MLQILCNNCDIKEKELLLKFRNKYQLQKDIGNEYFKGDYLKMIKDIYSHVYECDITSNSITSNSITSNSITSNSITSNSITSNSITDNKYECTKCKKDFPQNWRLQRHIQTCQGIKNPYECEYCQKQFRHKDSRFKHYRICKAKLGIVSLPNESEKINQTITTNNIQIQNNIQNNTNIIIMTDPSKVEFLKDHISDKMIHEMIKSPTHVDAVKNYVHALLARKENQCIRKTNMRANYSKIHVGNNHWQIHPDQTLYPKLMANIARGVCDLVQDQSNPESSSRETIIEKIIPFLDYMAGEGYCNSDNQSKVRNILQNFRELVRELKFIVCNNTLNIGGDI